MTFVCEDLSPFEIFPEISETGKEEEKKRKIVRPSIFNEVSTYQLILRLFIGASFLMSFLFRILIYNDAGCHGDGCH